MEASVRALNPTTSLSALHKARSLKFVLPPPTPPPPLLSSLSLSSTRPRPYYHYAPITSQSQSQSQSHLTPPPSSGSGFLGFLSLSKSHHSHFDPRCRAVDNLFEWHPAPEGVGGVADRRGGVGWLGNRGPSVTVVLLGWLGATQKHLRKYVDLYASRGINAVTFVVPVKDVLWFDLGRRVEERVSALSTQLASWLSVPEVDGTERRLLFHTFSNTGWLVYGAILDHLQGRQDLIEKIKGCVVDSGADAELNPKVWAAGFSAALLKKRSAPTHLSSEIREVIEPKNDLVLSGSQEEPPIIETLLISMLQKFFSYVLKLPDVNWRLVKLISLLSTNQPPCPQLYLYSRADKVIPFRSVVLFIEGQRRIGRKVQSFNFGSSAHVDHYRTFPHVYTSELRSFLQECLTEVKQV